MAQRYAPELNRHRRPELKRFLRKALQKHSRWLVQGDIVGHVAFIEGLFGLSFAA